jgi:hypothetical protein
MSISDFSYLLFLMSTLSNSSLSTMGTIDVIPWFNLKKNRIGNSKLGILQIICFRLKIFLFQQDFFSRPTNCNSLGLLIMKS